MRISRGAKRCLRLLRTFNGEQSIPQWLLAKKLRCSVRTVKRYIRELREGSRIKVIKHGPIEATYILLNEYAPQKYVPSSVPSFQTHRDRLDPVHVLPFSEAEAEAIERHVRGCQLEPTPQLLLTLAHKARFYSVNGFRVASAIERARRKVEGTSNMPRRLGWFAKVVESELAAEKNSWRVSSPTSRDHALARSRYISEIAPEWKEEIESLARAKTMR